MFLPELSIKRPVLATVMSLLIVLRRRHLVPAPDGARVSEDRHAGRVGAHGLQGREPAGDGVAGHAAARGQHLRHRGREEHQVGEPRGGVADHGGVRAGARHRRRRERRARPRLARARPAARRGGRADRRQDRGRRAGDHLAAAQLGPPRRARDLRLRRPLRRRPPEDAARAWRASSSAASAATRCACGSTASGWRPTA